MVAALPLHGRRHGAVREAWDADGLQGAVRPEEEARRTRVVDRPAEGDDLGFVEVADQEVILGRKGRGHAARPCKVPIDVRVMIHDIQKAVMTHYYV